MRGRNFLIRFGSWDCGNEECVSAGQMIYDDKGTLKTRPATEIEGGWPKSRMKEYGKYLPEAFVGLISHETIEYLVIEGLGREDVSSIHDVLPKVPKNPLAYRKYPNGLYGLYTEKVAL